MYRLLSINFSCLQFIMWNKQFVRLWCGRKTNFVIVSNNSKVTRVTSVVVFQLTGNRPTRKVNREKWRRCLKKKRDADAIFICSNGDYMTRCNPASIYIQRRPILNGLRGFMCVYGCVTTTHTRTYWTEADPALQTARQRKKKPKGWINLWYPCFIHSFSLSLV